MTDQVQRLSAREVALVFDVPPWLLGSDHNDWRTKLWFYRRRPIWLWRHGPRRWVRMVRGWPEDE